MEKDKRRRGKKAEKWKNDENKERRGRKWR